MLDYYYYFKFYFYGLFPMGLLWFIILLFLWFMVGLKPTGLNQNNPSRDADYYFFDL